LSTYLIVTIHIILERILLTGPTIFVLVAYITFCLSTFNHIRLYNFFFKYCILNDVKLDTDLLRQWALKRTHLHNIVGDMEKLLSGIVLVWYAFYCIGMSFKVLQFMDEGSERPRWATIT